MREILFRGKRVDDEDWVYGHYSCINHQHFILSGKQNEGYNLGTGFSYSVDEKFGVLSETICQYTGLTDKNGRKIFEGDIVRDIFNASVVGIVRYGEYRNTFNDDEHGGHVGFYVDWKEKQDLLRKDLVYWVKNSEFIGNIFDNPELIGEMP